MRFEIFFYFGALAAAAACSEQPLELGSSSTEEASIDDGVPAAPPAALDDRPAIRSAVPPPPIAGGTLHITSDGAFAIVADHERDTVAAVDLETQALRWTTRLDPSSRPGRVVESNDGTLHVALRGAGAIATLDRNGRVLAQTPVCADPSGLAVSEQREALLVACRDGALMQVERASYTAHTLQRLGPDLRDVVVMPGSASDAGTEQIYVTRFRSAEILKLGANLAVVERRLPSHSLSQDTTFEEQLIGNEAPRPPVAGLTMDAHVGWRAAPTADGLVFVHQRSRRESVDLNSEQTQGYGSPRINCSSLVGPAVTFLSKNGEMTSSKQLANHLLVDVAVSENGWVAVAEAGAEDPGAPGRSLAGIRAVRGPLVSLDADGGVPTLPQFASGVGVVTLYHQDSLTDFGVHAGQSPCEPTSAVIAVPEYNQAVAVAFNPERSSQLAALLRQPAQLLLVDVESGAQSTVNLSERSTLDTGHALFHQATLSGISCASCHPEGGEDGRVWTFNEVEHRRTQTLEIGLSGTAPFHWRGELDSFSTLMDDVFVHRMSGSPQSEERQEALQDWIFQLKGPAPLRNAADSLAAEGKALFESAEVGCATCHSGPKLTDNKNYDVGTGELLQVPALTGVAYRTPLMHNGCADDLRARFNPACGGGEHGNVTELTADQVDALVAYMETL